MPYQYEHNPANNTNRLYYLDWLRVITLLSVFFYHCNRFFDYREYPIQNITRSLASSIHREFFQLWMMPLFFIISGAAIYYALKSHKAGEFIKERILRILIPLVLIGIFVIAPPQIYLERLINGEFSGTFFLWYPNYFEGIYPFGGNFAFHGMHLWYLMVLFINSLILLPLFIPDSKTGASFLSRISTLFEKPWAFFLLFVPLAAMALLADIIGLDFTKIMGGWDSLSYLLFFIYGYLIFSNLRIHELIRRYSTVYFVVAVILSVFYLYLQFGSNLSEFPSVRLGTLILRSLLSWCWIIGLLGLGSRFLNFNNRFLVYANEAVLPFYILHQTVLLIIGFFVIQWNITISTKYIIITNSSFIVTMIIYELLVRHVNVLRLLFGLKFKKKLYAF